MALTKPILFSQPAFDATKQYVFTFNVVGGSQVVSNRLTIVNQDSGSIVYQDIQLSFSFTHILPANALANGEYYYAYLNTFDSSDNMSVDSNMIQFYCYTKPNFYIDNIPSSGIIQNSSYEFSAYYNQSEDELLNSYEFNLYDSQQIQISTSGVQYTSESEVPIYVNYTFTGFKDSTSYYIQAIGKTIEGTVIETDLIPFVVKYEEPSAFNAMQLSNNCKGGYILVQSNLRGIDTDSNPDPPIYVYGNTAVDLREIDSYVDWYNGFNLNSNFTASLWGNSFSIGSEIVSFIDNFGNKLSVKFTKDETNKFFAMLTVNGNGVNYQIFSERILLQSVYSPIQIWFRRINELFELHIVDLQQAVVGTPAILGSAIIGEMQLGEGED